MRDVKYGVRSYSGRMSTAVFWLELAAEAGLIRLEDSSHYALRADGVLRQLATQRSGTSVGAIATALALRRRRDIETASGSPGERIRLGDAPVSRGGA